MEKWNGKSKGFLFGYKFFVFCVNKFGVIAPYFFSYFVALFYFLFLKDQRRGLVQFYYLGLRFSKLKSFIYSFINFSNFGKTLIDRIALLSNRKNIFSYTFNNEKVLLDMKKMNKGGILLSGHLGNWENAGNLINMRITSKINVLVVDAEHEKIKKYLISKTGGPDFNIIPIKDDFSHLILINKALKLNEFIAIHADRSLKDSKCFEIPFFNRSAKFPMGPFILAEKFNVPITFVYGLKKNNFHYDLYASELLPKNLNAKNIAEEYVSYMEKIILKYPTQWFNFYKFYAS